MRNPCWTCVTSALDISFPGLRTTPYCSKAMVSHLIPSAFLYVMRHRGLQPELEPFPTREGSLCFPEGPFQTTLITESMAQPALQHLSDPAVSGFTMA